MNLFTAQVSPEVKILKMQMHQASTQLTDLTRKIESVRNKGKINVVEKTSLDPSITLLLQNIKVAMESLGKIYQDAHNEEDVIDAEVE